ncbi:MAG: WD40/YVTN/BNR-like repeat-containing protein [Candidatus Krumholzibacteriia bacterium]
MTRSRLLLLAGLLGCLGCSGTEETPVFGPGPRVWGGTDPDWTIIYPASGNERLLAACALADGEAWAVGTGGVVVHHDGARWVREESRTGASLADVATDGRLVCAVGSGGAIVTREAGRWRREESGTSRALRAVAVMADGTAWAGGEGGVLLRRTQGTWAPWAASGGAAITSLAAWRDTLVVGDAAGAVAGWSALGGRGMGAFAGTGVLRLAVSPGGTLFAAADSLYRYDTGRWIGLRANSDARLAANDNLLFAGRYALSHDGVGPGQDSRSYGPSLGDEIAAICAVGPTGALAIGQHGAFAWLDDEAWRRDRTGSGAWTIKRLADGTICSLLNGEVIAWEDDHWRTVGPLPPAANPNYLLDGLDRSRLVLRAGAGLLLGGRTWTVVPAPPLSVRQALIDPAGGLVVSDEDGIIGWDGREWRREVVREAGSFFLLQLVRTRAGEVFAFNEQLVMRREEGRWRELARLGPMSGVINGRPLAVVGRFPETLVLLGTFKWLRWDAHADSVQGDWQDYLPPGGFGSSLVYHETAGSVFALGTDDLVIRLRLDGRPDGAWEEVTGSLPSDARDLWVARDGAVMVQDTFGRVWRHPPVDGVRP